MVGMSRMYRHGVYTQGDAGEEYRHPGWKAYRPPDGYRRRYTWTGLSLTCDLTWGLLPVWARYTRG